MKTNLVAAVLLLLTSALYGQKITLTKDGVAALPITDTRLFPDLKDDIIKWAESSFRNGYDFQERGETIIIETIRRNALIYRSLGETYSYHVKVRFNFAFAEGKRRLTIDIMQFLDGQEPSSLKVVSLFNSKGAVKPEMNAAVKGFEENLERVVSRLALQWK